MIVVDTCLSSGDFIVTGVTNIDRVNIYNTQFQRMSWMTLEGDSINLVNNNIRSFEMGNTKLETLYVSKNTIEYLLVFESVFSNIDFDHNQIKLDNLLKRFREEYRYSILRKMWHYWFFRLTRSTQLAIELAFDKESVRHNFRVINSTLSFITKYTNINRNRKRKSDILFFEAIFHQNNWIGKLFIWICGGFVRPGRIVLNGLLIWLIFATTYYKLGSSFKINNTISHLSFINSLYFSGITFITLSYGDIIPVGISKILVVAEGAFGVIILSCIVVSLVRRFIGES